MRWPVACCAAFVMAGCGATQPARPPPVGDRQWRSNEAVVVRQLQAEIAATQIAGETVASARAALRSESSLYGLLVSYSDFAGCRSMVAAAGRQPRSARAVGRVLSLGCRHLEHASELFTRSVTRDDGASLLAAGRESGRALPALIRAAAALKAR